MKALSVKQPWGLLIVAGEKDIENRSWHLFSNFEVPQRVYIHIPQVDDTDGFRLLIDNEIELMRKMHPRLKRLNDDFSKGAIIGEVMITGCVHESDSKWFNGRHGFTLEDPVEYETPIPCKGALGFWTPPADVVAQAREASE